MFAKPTVLFLVAVVTASVIAMPTIALSNDLEKLFSDINSLKQNGDYRAAIPLARKLVSAVEKVVGPDHTDTAFSLDLLGQLYESQGEYAEAEPLFKRALAILEKALGPDHPNTVAVRENLAAMRKERAEKGGR